MGNSFFQFKQFRVEQAQSAMKVSTDACIQGAWTPLRSSLKYVLDAGTGTGLLALMTAQRNSEVIIDAVEILPAAAEQAMQNFASSPWSGRLNLIRADIRGYSLPRRYDLIICNPPFFSRSLLGPDTDRNQARHTLTLSCQDLFAVLKRNLADNGYAAVLLPVAEHVLWEELLSAQRWKIFHQLTVVPSIHKPANRIISLCSSDAALPLVREELVIREQTGCYTPEFTHLMKPFYLDPDSSRI